MKLCAKCCQHISDDAEVCGYCGHSTVEAPAPKDVAPVDFDAPGMGFLVLGVFFPIVGIILYLLHRDTFPFKAQAIGKGAMLGFIVRAAALILLFIVCVVLAVMGNSGAASGAYLF